MPVVTINGGPLDVGKKRELCSNITDALEAACVILPRENVAVGGKLAV